MDDIKQVEAFKALKEASRHREHPAVRLASIRVSPGAYFAAASVLTFGSALLLRSEQDLWALVMIGLAWVVIPLLALNDRLAFDGHSLSRRGLLSSVSQLIFGKRQKLSVADFERVETSAVRTLRRRGSVRYRYRSQITGKGAGFVFASGGKNYRRMIRLLFPLIHQDKLDARTIELRDYMCEPEALNRDVELLQLAPPDVIDQATLKIKIGGKRLSAATEEQIEDRKPTDIQRAQLLRRLGNQLRISGRLREAGEAFRRALNVIPQDAWLIYECARLLRSEASAFSDVQLLTRARAALRLSGIRAGNDAGLIALIGESQLECGELEGARRSFRQALEVDEKNFRAHLGLADVALRTGKLAHVIHHYREAARGATEKALKLSASREAEYYATLNENDDYLATELRRINWLQNAIRIRRLASRVTNGSILVALVGPFIDPTVGSIGWAVASSSVVTWISSLFVGKFLADRRKPQNSES